MDKKEFRKHAHEVADWMADFYDDIENKPVKSQSEPGAVYNSLPEQPPENPEDFSVIMKDTNEKILPGISHWQSPNFFAYFPANSSFPSILAEMMTATMGVQGMVWETSPAATELEEKVMNWLKSMTGIPQNFHGVIQDTASTATLVALLTARERISEHQINQIGYLTNKYRIYCSSEAHSSVEKAVKIAGFGKQALVKVEVDEKMAMIPEKLEEAIKNDIYEGLIPVAIVMALGTTGTVAIDPMKPVKKIAKKYKTWLHVDAAFAGTALVLPEYRNMIDGIKDVDSFVFNPHKWMFTNFDCSAYFVKDKKALLETFEIMPEYLKTEKDEVVNNYRDWGIQLGRRFRALKLWFVIRSMGIAGIREKVKNHILWAQDLSKQIKQEPGFVLFEPQNLSFIGFHIKPDGIDDVEKINQLNKKFLDELNASGKLYLSHTKAHDKFIIRMVIAQTYVTKEHVEKAWEFIRKVGRRYLEGSSS